MITLTKNAIDKLKEIADESNINHLSIRVKVIGGGCAGMSHDMEFDNSPKESDEVIEQDGITVLCDILSFQYMENVSIDYMETVMGDGFKFTSPDIKSTCGCGNSVGY